MSAHRLENAQVAPLIQSLLQLDDFPVAGLAKVGMVSSDGDERLRLGEADNLIRLGFRHVDAFAWRHRDGQHVAMPSPAMMTVRPAMSSIGLSSR
jgi:hypothetical protein